MPPCRPTTRLLRATGWEALAAADWPTARAWFEQAREMAETAEVLDGLSQVAHFEGQYDSAVEGQYDSAVELKELAFATYRRSRKPVEAADTARWLEFLHGTFHGNYFGLYGFDRRTLSRSERPSARLFRRIARANALP